VARIEREDLAPGAGDVHDAIDHERRRFLATPIGRQVVMPRELEVANVTGVDLLEWAETLLVVGAPVRHPVARLAIGGGQTSGIDGSGSRAAWILFEGGLGGGLRLCSLILNDEAGIMDAAGGPIARKRLEAELRGLVEVERPAAAGRQPLAHLRLAGRDAAGEADAQQGSPQSAFKAARTVFAISISIVKGPTPPGTGVSAAATAATSTACTSPTSA